MLPTHTSACTPTRHRSRRWLRGGEPVVVGRPGAAGGVESSATTRNNWPSGSGARSMAETARPPLLVSRNRIHLPSGDVPSRSVSLATRCRRSPVRSNSMPQRASEGLVEDVAPVASSTGRLGSSPGNDTSCAAVPSGRMVQITESGMSYIIGTGSAPQETRLHRQQAGSQPGPAWPAARRRARWSPHRWPARRRRRPRRWPAAVSAAPEPEPPHPASGAASATTINHEERRFDIAAL